MVVGAHQLTFHGNAATPTRVLLIKSEHTKSTTTSQKTNQTIGKRQKQKTKGWKKERIMYIVDMMTSKTTTSKTNDNDIDTEKKNMAKMNRQMKKKSQFQHKQTSRHLSFGSLGSIGTEGSDDSCTSTSSDTASTVDSSRSLSLDDDHEHDDHVEANQQKDDESCVTTSGSGSGSSIRITNESSIQSYTLYLIRHGEASHNVLEKAAKKRALEQAIAEGLSAESDETKHRMEEARKAVLADETLLDASLSDKGRREAMQACHQLKALVKEHQLPPPREVLVSPLSRTLETANYIFPNQTNDSKNNNDDDDDDDGNVHHQVDDDVHIHVREELRERCTGKPPDTRVPVKALRRRKCFQRFSMNRLAAQEHLEQIMGGADADADDENVYSSIRSTDSTGCYSTSSGYSSCQGEEDKEMLRERTRKLFDLLAESDVASTSSSSATAASTPPVPPKGIAIVTHKGYLRELERGPFGKPLAREFNNCEIRVYQVQIRVVTTTRTTDDDDDNETTANTTTTTTLETARQVV